MTHLSRVLVTSFTLASVTACSNEVRPTPEEVALVEGRMAERAEQVLDETVRRLRYWTDTVDAALAPVPYLRPAEESGLRRYLNAAHVDRARSLGVRPGSTTEMDALVQDGRLVVLEDDTDYWIVRDLDHSVARVTPGTRVFLERLGERFQAALEEQGLPPFRYEVTSVMRTAESQAELRETNVNAAGGVSSHEFGTTLDIAYAVYTAPPGGAVELDTAGEEWLRPYLDYLGRVTTERVAVGRSRELQAILGRVLREMQDEGMVMVLLERLQPVYHITVARDLAG